MATLNKTEQNFIRRLPKFNFSFLLCSARYHSCDSRIFERKRILYHKVRDTGEFAALLEKVVYKYTSKFSYLTLKVLITTIDALGHF